MIVQVILDGFGINPLTEGNAVALAKTPNLDYLEKHYPFTSLDASGVSVGLPWGEVGNSEVGHTNLGSGQVSYQNLPRISIAIEDKTFFDNQAFLKAIDHVKAKKGNMHLIGLVSNGGVHSHVEHLDALLQLMKKHRLKKNVFVHAFTDGRDTNPKASVNFITSLEQKMKSYHVGSLASIIGRYYAMDRNDSWDRTKMAYDLLTTGAGFQTKDPIQAIQDAYDKGLNDENLQPIVISNRKGPVATIQDGDAVIFFNFRSDRARQLTKAFVEDNFEHFNRERKLEDLFFVTMMQYESSLPVHVAFPPQNIEYPFGRIISEIGRKQFRISETEKYAHVTYFFNGGAEKPFEGEDRKIVPSPSVATYDLQPEMSSGPVTEKILKAISGKKYSFLLLNYPNPDMVGHTGNLQAGIKAVEACDAGLGRIMKAVEDVNGILIVCADHGNCEVMIDPVTGRAHKEHTTNPVPFIIAAKEFKRDKNIEEVQAIKMQAAPIGLIADIAPTVLDLMGLKPADGMSGRSFLNDIL